MEKGILKKDLSLLVVKPECAGNISQVISWLNDNSYEIVKVFERSRFSDDVKIVYKNDFCEEILSLFKKAYKKNVFGEKYYMLLLRHKSRNTINKLKSDVGGSKNYFYQSENTLRSKYGLKERYIDKKTGFEIIFNGFHKVDSSEELLFLFKKLNI